jgi:hypothetical protein
VALSAGTTYVVTIGDVRDIAGNRVLSNGSWAITPLAAAELDAFARPATLIFGATSTLRVVLSGAPVPASVQVEKRSSNTGGFVPVSTLAVVDGQASATVKPEVNTTYRFRYAGAFGVSSAQLDVPILVRRSIGLVGRSSSTVSRAKVGSTVTLVAAAGPAAAGVSVSFRLYHYDATRRAWVYAGSRGRSTNTAGRAVVAWVTTAAGSWYWRASVGSTVDFANNVSPVYRWTVSR